MDKISKTKMLIRNNVYDIPHRLKAIDDGYFVLFDLEKEKYEVHSTKNKGDTFCLLIPYSELDARTIDLVNETRIENIQKIRKKIKEDKERLVKERKDKALDTLGEITKDVYDFGQRTVEGRSLTYQKAVVE